MVERWMNAVFFVIRMAWYSSDGLKNSGANAAQSSLSMRRKSTQVSLSEVLVVVTDLTLGRDGLDPSIVVVVVETWARALFTSFLIKDTYCRLMLTCQRDRCYSYLEYKRHLFKWHLFRAMMNGVIIMGSKMAPISRATMVLLGWEWNTGTLSCILGRNWRGK